MYHTQYPYYQLHQALLAYDGNRIYSDVLAPWLVDNENERRWFRDFQYRTNNSWSAANGNDLCRLYALFRVTSVLLLGFQQARFNCDLFVGPTISVAEFQNFHEQLGFYVPRATDFHPFHHEIVSVVQSAADDAPIRIVDELWPGLMLGDLMFSRAGCVVEGGSSFVLKDVAEQSTLYWTYARRDRPCNDMSHGWGSNSQWRTEHRRDYCLAGRYFFNVDGEQSLNGIDHEVDDLSAATMIELVRNRCLIHTRVEDSDLFPYEYSYWEVVARP